jgi:phenylpyruvate tautomerase PptA (4-oxalocrotonate tautomerase family)
MPTYFCTTLEGRLTAEQKGKIAGEITRVHCEVTGAPSFFAQVIFDEVKPGNYFMGGAPLKHDQLFIYGHIRSGRAAVDKSNDRPHGEGGRRRGKGRKQSRRLGLCRGIAAGLRFRRRIANSCSQLGNS